MVPGGRLLAGRYQLDEPIGTGWFSEVWRATDAALSRPVAVKLLHPAYAQQPEALARFRAEALHAAALWHENITHIYDYDEPAEGPQPYLVMELVDGPSLAGVLAGGPLDAARIVDVVAQAAAGLQAAHAMGLVHRDIKPGSLLLASAGTVKITDWGISQAIGSVPSTVTGIVTGTAEYLAPEQITGAQAAPAGDLYALGIVAYECLTGAPPFVGEPPDVACAHRDRPVPPLPASVPADVSALVMQLAAKDPSWRPGSAAQVAQQAGRLRPGLRDDLSAGAGRTPYPLAAAAAAPPQPPAMAPAAVADGARRQVPAAPRAVSRAQSDARRRRRGPVLVLASVAIAGLIGMVLAITVGVVSVRHLAGAPPSARPGHSASGTVAGPPARQPSSASPSHSASPRHSRGDAGTAPVVVSDQRTVTGSVSGRERIRRHRDGGDAGHSQGHGHGNRNGHSQGHRNGNGHSQGHRNGNGHSQGHRNGNGHSQGHRNGTATARATGTGTARARARARATDRITATGTRRSSAFQASRPGA